MIDTQACRYWMG